jgi:membrane protein implicated in regulation of membrane protease activity
MNTTTSRFASFELLRIIVPGAYSIFLIFALYNAFNLSSLGSVSGEFGLSLFILGSIVSGLSFYSKETPKKRKAFQTNQPSIYILDRSRELSPANPLTDDEARRLYFYILNHHIPITMHDKVFFFGMIYHIMINIRRTSFWFGVMGIIGIIVQIAMLQQTTMLAVSSVFIIWLVYASTVRYNKADRKMQENYQDQIFWLEMNNEIVDSLIHKRRKQ